ncbi:MAG: hypothetical protein C0417_06870 [Chlorobiaceae bacterium]|nr:hypothetical protein [Chlorobiaceae bacterium]
MNKITVCFLCVLVYISQICATEKSKHLGDKFTIMEVTPIRDLNSYPQKYYNKNVKIEGIIASVCNEEGCFIEVVPKDGDGEGILVNFDGLKEKFPIDCIGRIVIVEGMFYQKVYPASRVKHWQKHSFRMGKIVPEFSLIKRILAKAVLIEEQKIPLPDINEISDFSHTKINLNIMEFETDGFGIGKKILKQGEVTEMHNSGNYREIIICLEGIISVSKSTNESINLASGEMTYIPPDTKHEIKNISDTTSVYIFVNSRKPENEKRITHIK